MTDTSSGTPDDAPTAGPAGTAPAAEPDDGLVTTVDGSARLSPRELRRRARAWAMYDVGNSAFQAVVVTFVFATYLASDLFLDPSVRGLPPGDPTYVAAQAESSSLIANLIAIAGVLVAILAPAFGLRNDGSGRRKLWLAIHTGIVVIAMFAMFAIRPDPALLVWGAALLAIGTVFSEFASVNYYAMLSQVSTRQNVGRTSGLGWGLGYIGSIVLLVILLVLFIQSFGTPGAGGILNVPSGEDGDALNIRLAIVVSAVWYILFAIPVFRRVPENPRVEGHRRIGFLRSYVELFRTIGRIGRRSPRALLFLLSSAIFRDALAAIFSFGAILAAQVYGFSSSQVIYFAVAANLVAGLGTLLAGRLDDRFGPKTVMVTALTSLVVAATLLLVLPSTQTVFWILGLFLTLFVGPIQAASRSYLTRLSPQGHEGEMFGLYATTGRAANFITPLLFGAFVALTHDTKMGIIGIAIVLAVGLALLLPTRAHPESVPVDRD